MTAGTDKNLLPVFPDELAAEQRLRRMRLIPVALLILMSLLFAVSLFLDASWAGWLKAFAEAAMVGALADWFAVTALFRHPLGIPIPHTAIVSRRKDDIGNNLARFIAQHFLTHDVLHQHLTNIKPGDRLVGWLQQDTVRKELSRYGLSGLHWVLSSFGEAPVRAFMQRLFAGTMPADRVGPWAGRGLKRLIERDHHQPVVSVLLEFLASSLSRQENLIRSRIKEGSPWWMPGFIDDNIAKQMLHRVESLLLMMATDERHSLRRTFNIQLHRLARELEQGKHADALAGWWDSIANQPTLQDYAVSLWQKLNNEIATQSAAGSGVWHDEIEHWLETWSGQLSNDEHMRNRMNQWLTNAMVEVISAHRDDVSELISDTVAAWDAAETSRRIELQIGPDLQFIRINGTLVGGLIGIILYAITQLAG